MVHFYDQVNDSLLKFAAKKIDGRVGIATVYRTIQLLEDMELIRKRWSYEVKESREKE